MNNLEEEFLEVRDILYQLLEAVESYSIITELREIKIEAARIRTVEYFNNLIFGNKDLEENKLYGLVESIRKELR